MAYTKEIGLKDFYKRYKESSKAKGAKCYDYKTFSNVIKDANRMLRDMILNEAATVELPYRGGTLSVRKFEIFYDLDRKDGWAINWKATKDTGKVVYHGEKYGYKWKWNKRNCRVKGKKYYSFKPCRTASRMIKKVVKDKQLDFYS